MAVRGQRLAIAGAAAPTSRQAGLRPRTGCQGQGRMIDSSPLPALANVHFEVADHHQLDEVVTIMEASFDDRFGEGWTRSQCAGILPMRGVSMLIARNDAGQAVGFSLQRIVIGDGELL